MVEGLPHDVHPHQVRPGVEQPDRHVARRSLPRGHAVDGLDGHDGGTGAGQEGFVGVVAVVGRQVGFHHLHLQPRGQLPEGPPGDASQHVPGARRVDLAVDDREEVVRVALGDVAVQVQHQGDGLGVRLPCFESRDDVVHLVGDLGLGLQALGRDAPGGRDHDGHAFHVMVAEVGEVHVQAEDDHGGPARGARAGGRARAPAHHLPQGIVVVRPQQVPVALQHLQDRGLHLVPGEAAVDPRVFQRPEQPVVVLPEHERLVPEGAGHVVNAVARGEPVVEDRDLGLALGHEAAVQIDDLLMHPGSSRPWPKRTASKTGFPLSRE